MTGPKLSKHGLHLIPGLLATHEIKALVLIKGSPDPARHVKNRPRPTHHFPLTKDAYFGSDCVNLNRKSVAFLVDQRVQAPAEVPLRSMSGGQLVQLLVVNA